MSEKKQIANNKKARFLYFIEDTIEVGIVLLGSEVKSLRLNGCNIEESYADIQQGEVYLHGSNIKEYEKASSFNRFAPRRSRKLLMHKKEIKKLIGYIQRKGYTAIPLSMYFNKYGIAKIELGLASGKKQHDKRAAIKDREWKIRKDRILKRGES